MYKHLLIIIFSFPIFLFAQKKEINQLDAHGKRHGYWKKTFEGTNQVRYEGYFKHGKEVDTFKFYKPSIKTPAAITIFKENSPIATQIYLAQNGNKISEGKLENKKRTGTWTYYHKNGRTIMMTEEYVKGKLHGQQITYFPDGKVAEHSLYSHGVLEGNSKIYTDQGILAKEFTYNKGNLNGLATYYNLDGTKSSSGMYKNNKKDGIWTYYENGKAIKEKKFPLPSGKIEKSN